MVFTGLDGVTSAKHGGFHGAAAYPEALIELAECAEAWHNQEAFRQT